MSKYSMGSVELLREQLRLREQNLAKLELQAARHGMDVPLALQNQMDFEIQKIEGLRKRLAKAEARPRAAEEEAADVGLGSNWWGGAADCSSRSFPGWPRGEAGADADGDS